jgi:hypothetical protein
MTTCSLLGVTLEGCTAAKPPCKSLLTWPYQPKPGKASCSLSALTGLFFCPPCHLYDVFVLAALPVSTKWSSSRPITTLRSNIFFVPSRDRRYLHFALLAVPRPHAAPTSGQHFACLGAVVQNFYDPRTTLQTCCSFFMSINVHKNQVYSCKYIFSCWTAFSSLVGIHASQRCHAAGLCALSATKSVSYVLRQPRIRRTYLALSFNAPGLTLLERRHLGHEL